MFKIVFKLHVTSTKPPVHTSLRNSIFGSYLIWQVMLLCDMAVTYFIYIYLYLIYYTGACD